MNPPGETLPGSMRTRFTALQQRYSGALLDDVIPFWLRHSVDCEAGGTFTCLERNGAVFDTDKFVWLQARQVWTFSMLFNRVENGRSGSRWPGMARSSWSGTAWIRRATGTSA